MWLWSIAPNGIRYYTHDWGSAHFNKDVAGLAMHVKANRGIHNVIFGNPALEQKTYQGRPKRTHRHKEKTAVNLQCQNETVTCLKTRIHRKGEVV
jgi:hypothetical protein